MRRRKLSKKYLIAITEESPKDKELILKNMQYNLQILEYIDQDLFKDIDFVKKGFIYKRLVFRVYATRNTK